ncbi:sulfatase family protein [Algoriphagus aquimarinus]|uniref:Arylsulfatase A n=1 Tax=Algoriphagus aquimarinus TaxID=237018 RepID=A0A1I1A557_9BACT|nr:sulfatase [Algoriphagus aquimarinus]SFB31718.1 Arylsulfatase A [Algoriphagus aquimarinus]
MMNMKMTRLFAVVALLISALFYSCNSGEKETPAKRPNILFAIMDDASFPHMGAYGTKWVNTPAFDYVAKEGLLFMNAYTPNAKCAPSRAAILTGRNSWQLEEAANHSPDFPAKFTTFMEQLISSGYHGGFTAKGWAPGNPGEVGGKPRELTGPAYNKFKMEAPTPQISSNDYAKNFADFLNSKEEDEPFVFWYGSTEPHRAYEFQSGLTKGNKKLGDIDEVPPFWPDTDSVRADMLDYAYEIEYFDQHLQKMIDELERRGELSNTIIVVTADNGMPFPRIKGQEYEYSNHLPLAVMWQEGITKSGRVIEDFISFIDFTPTFLEAAQVPTDSVKMAAITGRSFMDIFKSENSGQVDPVRNHVLIGKERHDVGRPDDQGYPIRGIVTTDYVYLHNFETDRWPAGNPETGYLNTDGSPTKTQILNDRRANKTSKNWDLAFGKRQTEELFKRISDPFAMQNLAIHPEYQVIKEQLKERLFQELKQQKDPRMFGKGYIFDEYPYSGAASNDFYNRFMNGEKMNAGWVNETDFEKNFPEKY